MSLQEVYKVQILKNVSSKVSIRTCVVEALKRVTAISQHDDFSHALIAAPKEKMSCGALPRQIDWEHWEHTSLPLLCPFGWQCLTLLGKSAKSKLHRGARHSFSYIKPHENIYRRSILGNFHSFIAFHTLARLLQDYKGRRRISFQDRKNEMTGQNQMAGWKVII